MKKHLLNCNVYMEAKPFLDISEMDSTNLNIYIYI